VQGRKQGGGQMRKELLLVASLGTLAATAPATVQPLNARTGLWQISLMVTWAGLPPQLQALMANQPTHNYQSCVTTADLSSNPWANGARDHCSWTVVRSSSTDMEIQGASCDMGASFGLSATAHGTIHLSDPEEGTGSFDIMMTGNGQEISGHASYTGKWLAARCPAE